MTVEERKEKERLEWFGGLYYEKAAGYYLESQGVKRCWQEAAKATREGKDLDRAVLCMTHSVPIQFPHAKLAPDQLWTHPEYQLWRMVNGNPNSGKKTRVPRLRPQFPKWSVAVEVILDPSMMDLKTFQEIVTRAGRVEGLYEARRLGFGRYTA